MAVLSLAALAAFKWSEARPRSPIPVGRTLPEFQLVDGDDQPVTRASLTGRATVIGFAFFHDAMHAPAALSEMRALAAEMRSGPLAGRVAAVSVTLAPEEDSPDHLRSVAASLGATPPWSIISGATTEVSTLLDALDVDWQRLQAERGKFGKPIFADDRFILVDGVGRVRGEYDSTRWTAMRRLRAELALVAAE